MVEPDVLSALHLHPLCEGANEGFMILQDKINNYR